MRTSARFGAKNFEFQNLWCARTDKGVKVEPVRKQGKGKSICRDFARTSFMDSP